MNQPAPAKAVRGVLALLVTVGLMYLVVLPSASIAWEWLATTARPTRIQRLPDETPWSEWLFQKSLEVVMATIFFSIGASVGSFLNVVVYRWPLHKPLFWQRSHCPNCGAGIRPQDNVPLLGWLRLGGRCRDCQTPISSRYPWIEGLMGAIFLWLFAVQLISGGWNLANREPNVYKGVVWVLFYIKWDLVGYYAYHCLLFALLMVAMLVDYDRRTLTKWQVLIGCCWLLVPPLLWSSLLLWRLDLTGTRWIDAVATMLVGGSLGATLGWCFRSAGLAWASGLWLGVALGWQAVLGVVFVAWIFRMLATVALRIFERPTMVAQSNPSDEPDDELAAEAAGQGVIFAASLGSMWLLMAALVHHSVWRLLSVGLSPYWPGPTPSASLLITWLAIGVAVWSLDRLATVCCRPKPAGNALNLEAS
jgi:prepilin signal peptidase PulO-like enzyme (type II secretory pathway)